MSLYLEQYLDNLSVLPTELRRNLISLEDSDKRAVASTQTVDEAIHNFVSNMHKMSSTQRKKQYDEVKETFSRLRGDADEKCQLATQAYELVDKHIRRLDSDLASFEADLRMFTGKQHGHVDDYKKKTPGRKKSDKQLTPAERKRKQQELLDEIPCIERNKKFAGGRPRSLTPIQKPDAELMQKLAGAGKNVLDMPIDPNEPTYCICRQVSYGDMVACDNPDCAIEWFHFGCVNLQAKPRGKWYCPICTEERKKK